ncbi:hypothetical protein H9P43_002149 [Blastocladiella emersonii ATCC 22665]|nr:hypothetical protein H9P43_002149 [Blastocladiella emersonii ATCC 22665]
MKSALLTLLLATALLSAAAPAHAGGPLAYAAGDAFVPLNFGGDTSFTNLRLAEGGSDAPTFLTLRTPCRFAASVQLRTTPLAGVTVVPCPATGADEAWRDELFAIPAGSPSVRIAVEASQAVRVEYRAVRGICNEPISTSPWGTGRVALTATGAGAELALVVAGTADSGAAANAVCRAQGMAVARLAAEDLDAVGKLVMTCGEALRFSEQDATPAHLLALSAATGDAALVDFFTHELSALPATATPVPVLCQSTKQRPRLSLSSSSGPHASCDAGSVPAVFSPARPAEYATAAALVFDTLGPNARAWAGGWNGAVYGRAVFLGGTDAPVPEASWPAEASVVEVAAEVAAQLNLRTVCRALDE